MPNFNENILAHHAAHRERASVRCHIVVQKVLRNKGSLCLPVTPDTHRAVVDMVAAENNVNCSMELDTGDLCAAELLHIINMVDFVVFNNTENASLPADDTCLLAVVDVAASYDVASDLFFQPSMVLTFTYSVAFHLGRALYFLIGEIKVVVRIAILSEGDTNAFTVADLTVLDDPAFAPVRSDHTVLESGRWSPCLNRFCSGDDSSKRSGACVSDAGIPSSGVDRIDIFAVNARSDENFVPCDSRMSVFCCWVISQFAEST